MVVDIPTHKNKQLQPKAMFQTVIKNSNLREREIMFGNQICKENSKE